MCSVDEVAKLKRDVQRPNTLSLVTSLERMLWRGVERQAVVFLQQSDVCIFIVYVVQCRVESQRDCILR